MSHWLAVIALAWGSLWLTVDQQGQVAFDRGEYVKAANLFQDPMRQGVAWYRAGEFKKAAQAFAYRDTPEANYNRGNALLMQGNYQAAIACYDRALGKQPDWRQAVENRQLASVRAQSLDVEGGDMTEGMLGADKLLFDHKKGSDGQHMEATGGSAISSKEVQALWLNRVQTKPADFLKAKFAYQLATRKTENQ